MNKINQKEGSKGVKHGAVKSLIKKAIELGVKVEFVSCKYHSLIKLTHNKKTFFIRRGTIPTTIMMGDMTRNKDLTKIILGEIKIKTPKGAVASSYDNALSLIKKNKLSFPLITKPLDGSIASGVTWDINSKKELKEAINMLKKTRFFKKTKKFLVEEMFKGDEFRVLLFKEKVISCVKKVPASITGDGKLSIKELIKKFNKKRMKGFEIKIDKIVEKTLKENKLTLKSVLPKNFNLRLRNNLNMSDGGRSIECTKEMNNYFKKICEKAMSVMGLQYGGVDLLAKDITNKKSPYVILELNSNPYYNMNEKPLVEGKGVDVSSKILKELFF